jgi:hypothetical protein
LSDTSEKQIYLLAAIWNHCVSTYHRLKSRLGQTFRESNSMAV